MARRMLDRRAPDYDVGREDNHGRNAQRVNDGPVTIERDPKKKSRTGFEM